MNHKHDPSRWNELFKKSWDNGFTEILKRYRDCYPMFEAISHNLNDKQFVEVGTGRGINSIILKFLNPKSSFLVTDYLQENLDLLQRELQNLGVQLQKTNYKKLDIISDTIPEDTQVVFSDGVLEHFSETEIKQSLQNQANAAHIFFAVPCNNADIDYGDEWIIPSTQWEEIIRTVFPNRKISMIPVGHKGIFFRFLRKIIPYQKFSGKTKNLVNMINKILLPIEKRKAASICFHIER